MEQLTNLERPVRVLIIDDEPMILGALRRSFAADYRVTCVGDGRRALDRLRAGERPPGGGRLTV